LAPGLIDMNLQCANLLLAVVSLPPLPVVEPTDEDAPEPANDNGIAWPLMPFPEDWCALN
jgi:hypothetical protein